MPKLFIRNIQSFWVSYGNGFWILLLIPETKELGIPQNIQNLCHVQHLYNLALHRMEILEESGCSRAHCYGRGWEELYHMNKEYRNLWTTEITYRDLQMVCIVRTGQWRGGDLKGVSSSHTNA